MITKIAGKAERTHHAYRYGTDAEYLAWLTRQPSCLDGAWNQWDDDEGRNIACHVRRLGAGSGMAIKPPFSAVPMTDAQHKVQSGREGELGALCLFMGWKSWERSMSDASDWFELQADAHLSRWIEEVRSK